MIAFAYKVSGIKPDYVTFDPFEILGIEAGASKSEIKKAYHRLSLIYHPDKETGDEKRFMKISKAYAALTDEAARKNWEEYGNPDGPGAMSFGIALPSWIVEKENSMIVLLVYVLMLMIALPIGVRIWWTNSSKYGGGFKVLLDTSQLYYFFIHKTPSMIMRKVVMVIAGSFEFNKASNGEIVERPSDNQELPQLIKEIPNIVPNNREPPLCYPYSIKARALLYAQMLRIPLQPNTLEVDKKYILSKCPYLIQEFVQCAAQLTMLALTRRIPRSPSLETIENAMKLNALIVQGLWVNKNALLQLPHVTEDMLRHFINRKRNIRNMQQLAQLDDTERRQILRILTDEQYQDVIQFIGQLPLLDVDVRTEVLDDEDKKKITAGALVTVTVQLTRRNMLTQFDQNAVPSNATSTLDDENEEDNEEHLLVTANNKPSKVKQWDKSNKSKKGKKTKSKKNKPLLFKGRQQQTNAQSVPINPSVVPSRTTNVEESGDLHDEADEHNLSGSDIACDEDDDSKHENGLNLNTPDDDDNDDWEIDINTDVSKKEIFQTISKISHSVHCPYFPEDKQEHWWIYISRKKPPSLITMPYFMTNLVEKEDIELKFTAPMSTGTYQYDVNVRCDSYVDMDYFKMFKVI